MWKVLTAEQLREADEYTVLHEPVSSILLMERAAAACVHWLLSHLLETGTVRVFCGPGNNGGDGLAIARLLSQKGIRVVCYTFGPSGVKSQDAQHNVKRLVEAPDLEHVSIHAQEHFPHHDGKGEVWIDALFGTGLNRTLEGLYGEIIHSINAAQATVVSIDMPSGLSADRLPKNGERIVIANHTLTFQCPKFSFFFSASGRYTGHWTVLDIGLDQRFIAQLPCERFALNDAAIPELLRPRSRFSHKGTYGHGLLVAGSKGMNGAAVLSAGAALRSGIGLLTVRGPACAEVILQTTVPEALFLPDHQSDHVSGSPPDLLPYKAVGIGPGLGTHPETEAFLLQLLELCRLPIVLDADALNMLSKHQEVLTHVQPGTVITPHPKEFDRLAGPFDHEIHRHEMQLEFSKRYNVVVILKGTHTCITLPDGRAYFNTTGNAGLARGGSGDVLTGMVLAFLAQGYPSHEAALLSVYLHGKAADAVLPQSALHSLLPEDVIKALPGVFSVFEKAIN